MLKSVEALIKLLPTLSDYLQGLNYVGDVNLLHYTKITSEAAAIKQIEADFQDRRKHHSSFWDKPDDEVTLEEIDAATFWKEIERCILYDVDGFQDHLDPVGAPKHRELYARYQELVNEFITDKTTIYINRGTCAYCDEPIMWHFETFLLDPERGLLVLYGQAWD